MKFCFGYGEEKIESLTCDTCGTGPAGGWKGGGTNWTWTVGRSPGTLLALERSRDTRELCLAALALRLVLDLTAPPPVSGGMEELPWLAGGSSPCDLRRLVLMLRSFLICN